MFNITIENVKKLYPGCKVVSVEEYYTREKKWTKLFADGTVVNDPDLYYEFGMNYVIARCIQEGAEEIQLKLKDKNGEYCYPDFKISELQNLS